MGNSEEQLLYRMDEAADALKVSRTTIWRLIRSGRLKVVNVGTERHSRPTWRVTAASVRMMSDAENPAEEDKPEAV
jgi:excisionase family DNA binding protein